MKISVIIPCYNQAGFLKETCNSVLNQTYANWEVLLINDGSTDDTEIVAKEICDNDERFKYFYKENGGLSSARNYGLDKMSGDYIQFLDSDDLLEFTKFEKSINSGAELCITNFEMLSTKREEPFCILEGEEFTYENVLLNWDVKFSIPIHCGLFSAKMISDIKFNLNLKAKEDWVFWLDFLKKKPKVSFINEPLTIYRLHDSNMCKDKSHMDDNCKVAYEFIYSKLSEYYKGVFFKSIAINFVNERSKCDYIYERYTNEKKKKNKITTILSISSAMLLIALIYIITVK
jgi:glycosyltransferase involved in cell wall biosynthesis